MAMKLPPEAMRVLKESLDRIEANGLVMYQCRNCELLLFFAETTSGVVRLTCPHCHTPTLHQWVEDVGVSFKLEKKK